MRPVKVEKYIQIVQEQNGVASTINFKARDKRVTVIKSTSASVKSVD